LEKLVIQSSGEQQKIKQKCMLISRTWAETASRSLLYTMSNEVFHLHRVYVCVLTLAEAIAQIKK
jgi:phage portal protein BeeE